MDQLNFTVDFSQYEFNVKVTHQFVQKVFSERGIENQRGEYRIKTLFFCRKSQENYLKLEEEINQLRSQERIYIQVK